MSGKIFPAWVLFGILATLVAKGGESPAGGLPDMGVLPAGVTGVDLVRPPEAAALARKPIIQHTNPFRIKMERGELPGDTSGISEMLLEVYDAEAGRWKGYGLMTLVRERAGGEKVKVVSASIDFHAPAEGIYCLRTVARDVHGHTATRKADLSDVEWTIVLDRTAPRVALRGLAEAPRPIKPGAALVIGWSIEEEFPPLPETMPDGSGPKHPHRLEVSYDGGINWRPIHSFASATGEFVWQVAGPDTDALKLRAVAVDAAGNVGYGGSAADGMALRGFRQPGELLAVDPSAAAARRAYQRGVIYTARGDLAMAAGELEEAIRHDPTLLPAYVDLSAVYLRLYDEESKGPYPGLVQLEKAQGLLEAALRREGATREVMLHYNLAQVLYRAGKAEECSARLRLAQAQDPRHIESLYFLAVVCLQQDKAEEAAKLWKQVAALGGRNHPLAQQAVRCLEALDVKARREAAQRGAHLRPQPLPPSQPPVEPVGSEAGKTVPASGDEAGKSGQP
jgi:hypothetical protein